MGTWQDPWAIDAPLLEPVDETCEAAIYGDEWPDECGRIAVGWRLDPEELSFRGSLTPWPACFEHA